MLAHPQRTCTPTNVLVAASSPGQGWPIVNGRLVKQQGWSTCTAIKIVTTPWSSHGIIKRKTFMRNDMKKLLIPLLLLSAPVFAAETIIKVVPPTKLVDGTDMPATGPTSLAKIVLERGTCNGTAFGTKEAEITITPPATQGTFTNVPQNSTQCYRGRAFLVNNEVSVYSNVVQRTITTPGPNAPVLNGTITIQW